MNLPKYQRSLFIIRLGLSLVFLAKSFTAFTAPEEFVHIIEESFLGASFPIDPELFVKFIGFNDVLVALLLLFGKGLKFVASYAGLWITGVMVMIGFNEPAHLLEHFGFLAMAAILTINGDEA